MVITLKPSDAIRIARRFGFQYPPSTGHGIHLPGDSGSLERPSRFKFEWIGTESELVRLSKRLGILRSANPVPLLTAGLVKRQIGMQMIKQRRRRS